MARKIHDGALVATHFGEYGAWTTAFDKIGLESDCDTLKSLVAAPNSVLALALPRLRAASVRSISSGIAEPAGKTNSHLISPVREPARVAPWRAVSLLAITTVPNSVINPGCSKIERLDTLGS
jgi:hypothetical protein